MNDTLVVKELSNSMHTLSMELGVPHPLPSLLNAEIINGEICQVNAKAHLAFTLKPPMKLAFSDINNGLLIKNAPPLDKSSVVILR